MPKLIDCLIVIALLWFIISFAAFLMLTMFELFFTPMIYLKMGIEIRNRKRE